MLSIHVFKSSNYTKFNNLQVATFLRSQIIFPESPQTITFILIHSTIITVSITNQKLFCCLIVTFISSPPLVLPPHPPPYPVCMVEEVKFLKATIDFDVLLATTREAVELYFEGDGIPVKYDVSSESSSKSMSQHSRYHEHTHTHITLKRILVLSFF